MIKRTLFSFATIALAIVSAASSYKITLFQTATVNGTELKPGDYKIEVKDDKAILTRGKESVQTNVRTETAEAKFSSTSVRYSNGNGKYQLQEIRLGGTNTKLIFEN